MSRVLIVDDHPVVRYGLRQLLQNEGVVKAVGEAGSAAQAYSQLRRGRWDAVLLDLNLPDRNGFDILVDIKARHPGLPVLIVSVQPEDVMAPRLLRAGAAGYLNKESAPTEILRAVRKVLAGGRYVSPALAEQLAEGLGTEAAKLPHETLSSREYQVMRLLADGKAVGEIAAALHLSVNTVSTYRARLLEKMGMASNAELTRYAFKHRLVQ